MKNHIILTNDYESVKSKLIATHGINNLRFFENDEILLDDTRAAINEAYIAENQTKIIVLKGNKYGIEAQNSLLLILEESPKNIVFILVAPSKNVFLPTICSRLFINSNFISKKLEPTGINFTKLNLEKIDEILNEKINLERIDKFNKTDLKAFISSIFKESISYGIIFNQKELDYIKHLMVLAVLNAKRHSVLTPLLLLILDKVK